MDVLVDGALAKLGVTDLADGVYLMTPKEFAAYAAVQVATPEDRHAALAVWRGQRARELTVANRVVASAVVVLNQPTVQARREAVDQGQQPLKHRTRAPDTGPRHEEAKLRAIGACVSQAVWLRSEVQPGLDGQRIQAVWAKGLLNVCLKTLKQRLASWMKYMKWCSSWRIDPFRGPQCNHVGRGVEVAKIIMEGLEVVVKAPESPA